MKKNCIVCDVEDRMKNLLQKDPFRMAFAGIALIYVILFSMLPADSIWISDEGNRIMSVQAYAFNGNKTLPDPFAGIASVPDGLRAYPKPYFIPSEQGWRSAYQLFFPYVTSWIYGSLGQPGALAFAPVMGLLTILFAGLLAREVFKEERKAVYAMLLSAFCSPVFFYSGTFLETTAASCFAMLSLWLIFHFLNHRYEIPAFFAAGIFAGISILFREEGFIFAFGLGLGILFCCFSWKRIIALGIGGALCVFPLLIYNYVDSGSIFGMHSVVYKSLGTPEGNHFIFKLTDYSFYLYLLCLSKWNAVNLVLPWLMFFGMFAMLIPKAGQYITAAVLWITALCCGASLYCNVFTEHGGAFIFQSLLDHLPVFALCMLCAVLLFKEKDRTIRFLFILAASGCFIPPLMLNYHQPGMFWGGRHFLNVVPVLCILTLYLLNRKDLSRGIRICGCVLVALSILDGIASYAVLSAKKNYSASYVRELGKEEYKVILTDVFWLPEELAWISREKNIIVMTQENSLDQAVALFKKIGIRKFHLILGRRTRMISNESLKRLIDSSRFEPLEHYKSPMFSYFEIQIFKVELNSKR